MSGFDMDQLLHDDARRWNGDRPGLDLDEQVAAALAGSSTGAKRRVHRLAPLLAAAAVLVAVLVLVATGVFDHRAAHHVPATSPTATAGPLASISGVLWKDPASDGTVVFEADTMRVFDGCSNAFNALHIVGGALVRGHEIGDPSTCAGAPTAPPGPPGAAIRRAAQHLAHFYAVIAGPAAWRRVGHTLTLTTPGKGTLRLVDGGPAVEVTGTTWRLTMYEGTDSYSHEYTGPITLVVNQDATFEAGDGCRTRGGTAIVGIDSIQFHPRVVTACSSANPAGTVVDAVLSRTVRYAIRGSELILYGRQGRLLIYAAAANGAPGGPAPTASASQTP